jgi:homoserine kinase type II
MALITAVGTENLVVFLEKFAISNLAAATALAAGSVNSNFRIRADEKDYFLRIYEEQDLAGARRDAETVAALALAGVPTPPPIPKAANFSSDHAWIAELEGKPAALFPWKHGEIVCQARVTTAHVASVGRALARTHLAGSPLAARYGVGRFRAEDLRERISRVERSDDERISSLAPALKKNLEAISAARSADLPRGLAHGDLFRDNVLFTEAEKNPEVLALLDFESAFEGVLIFDVMVTMLAWCTGDAIDFDLARALVDGYQSVRPLEAIEKKYAFQEARFASVRFWITRVTDYAMRLGFGNGRDPGRFEMRLRQLEALGEDAFRAALFS